MSLNYNDLDYEIEKQLSVEEHKAIKDWSLRGFFFYVLFNMEHKFRLVYVSRYKYPMGKKFIGKQLKFVPISPLRNDNHEGKATNRISFKTINGSMDEEYVDVIQSEIGNSFASLFMKIKIKGDGNIEVLNQHNIHNKKICIDKPNWFLSEIKSKSIENPKKKVIKELMQDTKTDDRLLKLVKTELFEFENNEYMHMQGHSIVLTQGGTGKTSILGVNGVVKQKNSDAGIFGYFNTSANVWISGSVSQTQKTIIIDEINEILNATTSKGEDFMTSINSALENGTYSYGKAGGRQITFGNQFIFCGNISPEFTFESFVSGIATNVETIGRRFCYFIYDHKLLFEKGKKRRPVVQPEICVIVGAYLTYLWKYFVVKRKFIEKTFNKKNVVEIEDEYKNKIYKLLKSGEFEGRDNARKFLESFTSSSIGSRLKNMAFKIALFNNLNYFLAIDDLNKQNHSQVYEDFKEEYKGVLHDVYISIENVIKDFSFSEKIDYGKVTMTRQFNNLSKSEKEVLNLVFDNYANIENNKLDLNEIGKIGNCKYIFRNWKSGIGVKKNFRNLTYFGVLPVIKDNEIYFTFPNKNQFEKSFESLTNGVVKIDMTDEKENVSNDEKKEEKTQSRQIVIEQNTDINSILDELEESDI